MTPSESQNGRQIYIGHKKKIALVCSGGAAKAAAYHLGVALALQEQGFQFVGGTHSLAPPPIQKPGKMKVDTYVGSSAGSLITTFLAIGYTLDNIFNSYLGKEPVDPEDRYPRVLPRLTYQKLFRVRPEFIKEQAGFIFNLRKNMAAFMKGDWEGVLRLNWVKAAGLFSTRGLEEYLREDVLPENRFQDLIPDLFVVATQLNHSRKVVFGKHRYEPPPHDLSCAYDSALSISEAVAASTSLPPIFAPWTLETQEGPIDYIDGEIRETLSTHVAVDNGADLVIASYTHQPYHFQAAVGSLVQHGLPSILIQSLYLMIEQKINSTRHARAIRGQAIDAVIRYCDRSTMDEEHKRKIVEILEKELYHRRDVDVIYIHPRADDAEMFFGEHFNLSAVRMAQYVRSGFHSAIEILKKYKFADRGDA